MCVTVMRLNTAPVVTRYAFTPRDYGPAGGAL
jgi:hypothetical protein